MKICVVAPAKSGSTAVYNSVRSALSKNSYCYGFFEPQRPYPLLRLKNYDFSENFVTKIMVSRMISEKSNFHMDWFDKRILLVRDVKDLMVSELMFRPMVAPLEVSAKAMAEFVELIKEKERDPQCMSVLEIHKRANTLGISGINWEIYRNILSRLAELRSQFECSVVHFEDYASGDYSSLSQVLSMPVRKSDLEGSWVSHIQRKGQSGEWRNWFTPEDTAFAQEFFSDYNAAFDYETPIHHNYNTEPLDPQFGTAYIEKKYMMRRRQMEMLNDKGVVVQSSEDFKVLASRARDGGVGEIERLTNLKVAGELPSEVISSKELNDLEFFRKVIM